MGDGLGVYIGVNQVCAAKRVIKMCIIVFRERVQIRANRAYFESERFRVGQHIDEQQILPWKRTGSCGIIAILERKSRRPSLEVSTLHSRGLACTRAVRKEMHTNPSSLILPEESSCSRYIAVINDCKGFSKSANWSTRKPTSGCFGEYSPSSQPQSVQQLQSFHHLLSSCSNLSGQEAVPFDSS